MHIRTSTFYTNLAIWLQDINKLTYLLTYLHEAFKPEDFGEYGYSPSLAIKSASINGQPKSANMRETVLFPEAIPPVTATKNILTKK